MRTIQIRHVPVDVHRTLKVRAAQAGKSLSDYLLAELESIASLPTTDELFERIRRRGSATLPMTSAQAVRLERDSRR